MMILVIGDTYEDDARGGDEGCGGCVGGWGGEQGGEWGDAWRAEWNEVVGELIEVDLKMTIVFW